MNNKGFTLVELLATIVIVGLVLGIASYGVISAIDTSKKKSEEVFVSTFTSGIESYLSLKGSSLKEKEEGKYNTCGKNITEFEEVELSSLANEEFIDKNKFINPRTKDSCYNDNIKIRVFRDEQYVYYYYFDFDQFSGCGIDSNDDYLEKYRSDLKDGDKACTFVKSADGNGGGTGTGDGTGDGESTGDGTDVGDGTNNN